MIVEVRIYTTKPGLRQRFIMLFETRIGPLQRSLGMGVAGPWIDAEHPARFVWLRSFPSMLERETMKRLLYEGAEWTGELEAMAMPMLADFVSILVEMDLDELANFKPANHKGAVDG